jgi:hypothetical protein
MACSVEKEELVGISFALASRLSGFSTYLGDNEGLDEHNNAAGNH